MKKLLLNLLPVIACMQLSAQNLSNPYASIGKQAPKVATMTDGDYEEFFKKDSLVQIGTTIMNRNTGEVAFLSENNSEKFKQFTEHNEKNFRFLSIDPLTRRFPFYTPYQFAGNKPIYAIDLDGLEDVAYIYRMQGNTRTLIQTIDYTKTKEKVGPLGHGTYAQIINQKGDKFSEAFITKDGNSIPSFSDGGINRKNFTDIKTRLNARLIEKTVENALVKQGFDKSQVGGDVQVLDTDAPGFVGKFATFKEGTADKYTTGWDPATPSDAHQSKTAKQSGEIGNSDVLMKSYDGAKSSTDNIPNQIGLVREGIVDHGVEAVRSLADPNVNIGAENAARVKTDTEKKP